jgi:phenylalanyl-tRNA synthetase beta chain
MRIDGYDNIDIPRSIMISPSTGAINQAHVKKEKIAGLLTGAGFNEIFTNSITNAAYFEGKEDESMVRLLNNLSAVHNVMRPSMLETGLESVAYNINRKNLDLKFFEFGKTYSRLEVGRYDEDEHLCLYITGTRNAASWKEKSQAADVFYLKGMVEIIVKACGLSNFQWTPTANDKSSQWLAVSAEGRIIGGAGAVHRKELRRFDIKQDVYFADIHWGALINESGKKQVQFQELPNQLPVTRDLAMVLDAEVEFGRLEDAIRKVKLPKLKTMTLFDVFESEKLGAGKKSLAVSFMFLDEEKTLTDKEIDGMMNKIMRTLEQDLRAEIRKGS